MKIKGLLIGLVYSLIASTIFAQTSIEWGEQQSKSGGLINVLPLNPSNFYTLRWQGTSVFGGYYISKFDELKEVKSKRIITSVNNNIANFEDVILIEERPAVVLSNVKDGRDNIYLQQYGYDLEPRGEAKLIASYDLIKGKTKDPIQVVQSKDKKFTAIIWMLIAKKRGHDLYGFKVLDSKMNVVQQGEYEIPFESRNCVVSNNHLTNNGEFFFTVTEYDMDLLRDRNSVSPFKGMYLYQVVDADLKRYKLPLKGRRVEAASITSDDESIFTITGCYGEDNIAGIAGVFVMTVDFKNEEIDLEGFQPFDRGFITQNWSDREVERLERRIENGNSNEPTLYNYTMREAQMLSDGSIVGAMEQYYVQRRTVYNGMSYTNINYIYYYNDIVTFRFDPQGNLTWIQKIPKIQTSTNDGGPYSSYAFYIDGQNVNLVFNDNKSNYSESGTYNKGSLNSTAFGKKNNVVAHVKVDLTTGLTTREVLLTRKEIGTLIKPKLFTNDPVNKEMIVFTVFRGKEKFGVIKY